MSQTNFFDEGSSDDLDFLRSSNGPRKVPFYGTLEQSMYRYEKENQNQLNRLLEVRRQEAELAKQKVEEAQRKKQKTREQDQKEEMLQEYAKLLQMREEIMKAKELGQTEIGRAHRDADVSRKLKEDQDAYLREEKERHAEATRQRSSAAAATLKEWDEEMNGPRRRLLETKKQVQKNESDKAHLIAAEYREKEKIQPEEKDDYISYQPFNKNISRGVYSRKVFGDYSKTNLHNSVVVSHKDEEGQISAFEAARIESEKTQTRRDQALTIKDEQRKKSLSRHHQHVEKEKEKKYQEDFDKHMERLKKAANQQKIDEGKKYPEMQTKPATSLQNKARTQKEAEKAFEEMFVSNNKKISYPEPKGKENRKSLQKARPPSAGAAKNPKEKSAQKNVEGSMLSGYNNFTQRTEDLHQQQDMMFDESQEVDFDEVTPKAGNTKAPQSSTKKVDNRKPENPFKKNTVQPSVSISEDVSPTYFNKGAKNAYKEEEEEESFGEYSESDSEERDEHLEQSKSSQGQKPYGVASFGERKQQQQQQQQPEYAQQYNKNEDPASLRPKHLQRALSSSYQVDQGNSMHESASKGDELGQSQSSGFSDSRMRSDRFGGVRSEEISPQKTFSEAKRKQVPDDDIKNYISEQEHFLRKLDDDRKKLNDKLKASSQGGNAQPVSQAPQKSAVQERAERSKAALPQISREEEETFQLLQKKASDLLSRFMQPEESKLNDSDEEPKYDFKRKTSPQKVSFAEGSKPAKPSYMMESQKSYKSPERRENVRTKQSERSESPASDLDYSMSERDRSEKKSYTNSRNDYAVSFGERGAKATETFGRSQKPFDESLGTRNYDDYKKPWKMEFDVVGSSAEKKRSPYKEQKKPWKMEFDGASGEENRRRSPQKEQKKAWKMEFDATEEREVERDVKKNEEGGPSLAELFQKNRKKMVEKYENQKEKEKTEAKEKEVVSKPSRTKEEILKQRKAMMEYRGPVTQKKQENNEAANQMTGQFGKERKSSKEPKPELLDRLALGKKAKVTKKDMHALTSKNYELLPEIKKKKEEERKKEEMKKRRENVKKLDQNIRSKTLK